MSSAAWPATKPCHPSFVPFILTSSLSVRITDDDGYPYLSCTASPGTEVFVHPDWEQQQHLIVWCDGQTAIVDNATFRQAIPVQ